MIAQCMDGWIDGWMYMYGQMYMYGWMDGCTCMNGLMDGKFMAKDR